MPERDDKRLRILMAGGGTGGHLFPALAIAGGLRHMDDQSDIRFIGSRFGLEARVLPEENEIFYPLNIRGIQRGLGPVAITRNILFPWRMARSFFRCHAIIRQFRPHVVVGTGGYAAGVPLLVAQQRGIPTLLHEQNSYPGITTRRLAKRATLICLTYESSARFIPSDDWTVTGNPVRFSRDIPGRQAARKRLGLPARRQVLFILGGSQGSRPLNRHFLKHWRIYTEDMGAHLLWQTGPRDIERISKAVADDKKVTLVPFIHDMAAAYIAADLVVCRAGASTIAEIICTGRPSVLVPLPSAAADHQTQNAMALVKHNSARLVTQSSLPDGAMEKTVKQLIRYPDRLRAMRKRVQSLAQPDATTIIVNHILRMAEA